MNDLTKNNQLNSSDKSDTLPEISDLLSGKVSKINTIINGITIVQDNQILKFMYGGQAVGYFQFKQESESSLYFEMLGSLNANSNNFKGFYEQRPPEKFSEILGELQPNFSIHGLGTYIMEEAIKYLKEIYPGVTQVRLFVANRKIPGIIETLQQKRIIKSYEQDPNEGSKKDLLLKI